MLRRADLRQNVRARRNSRISARAMKQSETKSLGKNIGTIPKNMLTNFELKQLKRKLDIVKKPENRVHELTDSNVSRALASTINNTRLETCRHLRTRLPIPTCELTVHK